MGSLPFGVQGFEYLKDAVVIVDNASVVLYLNNAAANLYDVVKEAAIGKQLADAFVEESSFFGESTFDSSLSVKGNWSSEVIHTKNNGHKLQVHVSLSEYYDSNGKEAGKIYVINTISKKEGTTECKLESSSSIDQVIDKQELANIIDSKALQSMMEDLYSVTKISCAVIDLRGNVVASAGWQDICSKFHRVNPKSLWNCLESDLLLTRGVGRGEFRAYKCKNNMWDIVTPLIIGRRHVGNVFAGQFFFDDEVVDRELFAKQAEFCGFDKKAYLAALDRVPTWNRKIIESLMQFYVKLSEMISKLSYSNLKLTKALSDQKVSELDLRKSQHDLNRAQAVAKTGSWRLNVQKNELLWSDETYRLFKVPKGTPLTYQSFLVFVHPDDRDYVDERWRAALQGESYDLEHRIVVEGDVSWVHEKAELEFDAEGTLVAGFGTVQDITEHKIDEERLRKLNRAMRAISNSNQALMRSADETAFLQQGCRIIVEDCGYTLVWIGFVQGNQKQSVKPMAYAGIDKGFIDSMKNTGVDTDREYDSIAKAVRTGKIQTCNDLQSESEFDPYRKEALERGYLSSIVLPLIAENKVFGVINIYSKESNSFTDEEINLLAELASDFSNGITVLRMRAANERAKEALLYNKERFSLISETASSLLSAAEPQTIVKGLCEKVMAFLKCDVFFNYLVDEEKSCLHLNAYVGMTADKINPIEWLQFGEAVSGSVAKQGERIVCDSVQDSNDPRVYLVRSFGVKAYACTPLFSNGKVIGTLSFGSKQKPSFTREDLSLIEIVASQVSAALQRKKDEELVKTTRNRFYDSLTNMHGSLLLLSPNKRVEFVNQSFCDYFNLKEPPSELQDLTLEEMLGKIKGSFLCPDQEISRIREIVAAGKQVIAEEIALQGNRVSLRDFIPLQREGKSLGGLWHHMDITMQKRAEEALLKARIEWERTFDSLPDLIAIIDQKHRILRVNKSMADRLGLKPEQCFGLQCFVCVHETNEAPSFCPHVKTLKDGRKHIVQIHDDKLGGDFVVSTSPLTDENGKIFATIHIAREIDDDSLPR